MFSSRRVLVVGLDWAESSPLFERRQQELSTLSRRMDHGAARLLESSHSPRAEQADGVGNQRHCSDDWHHTSAWTPQDMFREGNGVARTLVTYFSELYRHSVGSLGHIGCYTFENDTAPDDATHAHSGMSIVSDCKHSFNEQSSWTTKRMCRTLAAQLRGEEATSAHHATWDTYR